MKVFDLVCDLGHGFEGWFGSEADHRDQVERGLLTCPVCGSASVTRRPSAPRLNLQHARGDGAGQGAGRGPSGGESGRIHGARSSTEIAQAPSTAPSTSGVPAPEVAEFAAERLKALQGAYVQVVRQVLAHTEDVGPRFAEEARRIHYGESESRHIRGQSTPDDLEALRDEGIEVVSLPIPPGLDQPVH